MLGIRTRTNTLYLVAAAIPAGWWIQKSAVTPEEEENSTKVHPGKKDHLNKNDKPKGA